MGMVLPFPDGATRHPGGERGQRPHHTISTASIHPPLPQCAQHNGATSVLSPDLQWSQSLPTKFLLPIPHTESHIFNPRPGLSHMDVSSPHTSSIIRTSKYIAVRDAGPFPLVNSTGSPLQGIVRIISGPTVLCGYHHTGATS